MLDNNGTLFEDYIINFKGESFTDSAAKMEKQPNEQAIPLISSSTFKVSYFFS
jgi:hypothetical protein